MEVSALSYTVSCLPSFSFGNHRFVIYVCGYMSVLYVSSCVRVFIYIYKMPHIINIIWYLSFSLWLTLLSIIISRSLLSIIISRSICVATIQPSPVYFSAFLICSLAPTFKLQPFWISKPISDIPLVITALPVYLLCTWSHVTYPLFPQQINYLASSRWWDSPESVLFIFVYSQNSSLGIRGRCICLGIITRIVKSGRMSGWWYLMYLKSGDREAFKKNGVRAQQLSEIETREKTFEFDVKETTEIFLEIGS